MGLLQGSRTFIDPSAILALITITEIAKIYQQTWVAMQLRPSKAGLVSGLGFSQAVLQKPYTGGPTAESVREPDDKMMFPPKMM